MWKMTAFVDWDRQGSVLGRYDAYIQIKLYSNEARLGRMGHSIPRYLRLVWAKAVITQVRKWNGNSQVQITEVGRVFSLY